MTDERIAEAFAFGAGDLAPGPDLPVRIALELRARQARQGAWRRVTVAVAALALAVGVTVAAVPAARGEVQNAAVTFSQLVFRAQVGKAPAEVRWADGDQAAMLWGSGAVSRLERTPVSGVAEAAKQVGFQPVTLPGRGAARTWVGIGERGDGQARLVILEYKLGEAAYALVTEGSFRRQGDQWRPAPRQGLGGLFVGDSTRPRDVSAAQVGKVPALCLAIGQEPAVLYACQWLHDGRAITLAGPDKDRVLALIKEATR